MFCISLNIAEYRFFVNESQYSGGALLWEKHME